jgi:hypothetical protein
MSRWELLAAIKDCGGRLVDVIFQGTCILTPRLSFPDLFEAIIDFQAIRSHKQIQTPLLVETEGIEI